MSTSDSFLNIGAAAVSRDIPRALGRPIEDDETELRVTQAALAGLTIVSTLIVFYSSTLVGILGTIGWGFFAAAFVAIAALGLNWKGATSEGAVVAIVGGLLINLFFSALPRIADVAGFTGIAESVNALYPFTSGFPVGTAALLVTIVLFVGVSLATQEGRTVPKDIAVLLER
jgi:sodium/proline symporter/sodium/pantothenate symporter